MGGTIKTKSIHRNPYPSHYALDFATKGGDGPGGGGGGGEENDRSQAITDS